MAFRNLTKTFVDLRNGAKANKSLTDSFSENSNNGLLTVCYNDDDNDYIIMSALIVVTAL